MRVRVHKQIPTDVHSGLESWRKVMIESMHDGQIFLFTMIVFITLWYKGKEFRLSAFLRMAKPWEQAVSDIPEALGAPGSVAMLIIGCINGFWWLYSHGHPVICAILLISALATCWVYPAFFGHNRVQD
jgi:hypothetical protein